MNHNPKWQPAIAAVDAIIAAHGSSFRDRDTGDVMDAGQLVCRDVYGPHWMHTPEFEACDVADEPPRAFLAAAHRLAQRLPTWAIPNSAPTRTS